MESVSAPLQLRADAVTTALAALRSGERGGLDAVFSVVYPELHALAHRQLVASEPRTLSTTALVHELYLKFSAASALDARDRSHFLAVSARAMRQIIVDAARRARAAKRQAPAVSVPMGAGADLAADLIALDTALTELQHTHARLGSTVELRFFGGLSVEETAEALGVSPRTVKRDWRTARALLYRALSTAAAAG